MGFLGHLAAKPFSHHLRQPLIRPRRGLVALISLPEVDLGRTDRAARADNAAKAAGAPRTARTARMAKAARAARAGGARCFQ
jgi:hypothetical protein